MTKKRKPPSGAPLRPVEQIPAELESPEFSHREQAVSQFWDLAPQVEVLLATLLRGLNDPDELIRYEAVKLLLRAFPSAEAALSRLLTDDIASPDSKVRLAAIRRVFIILPNVLAALAGISLEPGRENFMEHAGRWVAWTRDRQRVLAVADSFADVMQQALASGETAPYVKKTPRVAPDPAAAMAAILDDESPDIRDDISKLFPAADAWLDSPNSSLGGEKPRDLLGTAREREVRDLLRGIQDGITT